MKLICKSCSTTRMFPGRYAWRGFYRRERCGCGGRYRLVMSTATVEQLQSRWLECNMSQIMAQIPKPPRRIMK